MRTIYEMTTGELVGLKAKLAEMIRELIRQGGPTMELANFRHAIDNELDRRGA